MLIGGDILSRSRQYEFVKDITFDTLASKRLRIIHPSAVRLHCQEGTTVERALADKVWSLRHKLWNAIMQYSEFGMVIFGFSGKKNSCQSRGREMQL